MIVFSSLEAASREGFCPYEFDEREGLWVVIAERTRHGHRERMLALARPNAEDSMILAPARA